MRSSSAAVLVAASLAVLALSPGSGPASAAPRAETPPSCVEQDGDPNSALHSPTDLDADALSDVVVGVPAAGPSGLAASGAVDVHYGAVTGTGRTQRLGEATFAGTGGAHAGDRFGSSVAFTHLRDAGTGADPCADLVVGAPGVSGGRGSVVVAHGSNAGITTLGAVVVPGRSAGERFGTAVVADGDDVWVGAPDRAVDGAAQAGAVDHYRVTGGTATLVQSVTESSPGVPGLAEASDHFGAVLSVDAGGTLVVGEPDEDIGDHARDAGTVTVLFTSPSTGVVTAARSYSQNTAGIPGTAEAGDRFGAGVSSTGNGSSAAVAVGVPGEALGRLTGAGTVDVFTSHAAGAAPTGASAVSQGTAGVPGSDEAGDHLGQQVSFVAGDVCAGVPGEDLGALADAGRVLCNGSPGVGGNPGRRGWISYQQGGGAGGLGGTLQAHAAVGTALSRIGESREGDFFDGGEFLVLAAPSTNRSGVAAAGVVTAAGRTVGDSAGAIAAERYGVPATAVDNGASYDTR